MSGIELHKTGCVRLKDTTALCNCGEGRAINEDVNESWHKVHAALLKSVAEAQAKLLAGINDVDREGQCTNANTFLLLDAGRALATKLDAHIEQSQEQYKKLLLLIGITAQRRKARRTKKGKKR